MRFLLIRTFVLSFVNICYAIISGRDAQPHEFPSVTGLYSSRWFGDSLICGATIVSPNAALTAASCCDGSSASGLKLRVGSNDRTSGYANLLVTKIIKHPSWNRNTLDNNYCILRTYEMPIRKGLVEISPLPASDKPPSPMPVVAAGWGKTGPEERTVPTQLQAGNFSIVDYETCSRAWSDEYPITPQMVCFQPTGAPETTRSSACQGDNGGPVLSVADGSLVGVISHTDACSLTRPNVAANVAHVVDWVRSNI